MQIIMSHEVSSPGAVKSEYEPRRGGGLQVAHRFSVADEEFWTRKLNNRPFCAEVERSSSCFDQSPGRSFQSSKNLFPSSLVKV